MGFNPLRVVAVGGGIVGASIAWHFARSGAQVTLLEKQPAAAGGATHWSFGWVGTGSALPEFARLARELGPLPVTTRGALVWLDSDAQTAALIDEQRAAGAAWSSVQAGEMRVTRLSSSVSAPDRNPARHPTEEGRARA
ncbi:FAD-binding oxidoreductase [Burkholderia cepacia]|uniref:FAD-binding oxidoreductase n=2 Tax=Burkholderia cepacia TaxID=292 RepID=A0AAX2R8Y1_BURCE|nr:FAD-dependent oxidoreductase [Burkholderia cepacia]TES60660.1 FAD-binding oxidoreductase [Burkholderia cepacia]TES95168.1 FAD-binding oxidoreductase [Burkholderia cepacia]TEU31181.1 FAD-binding oxidoreductase [Burkholderia cepacia]TEU32511.1 FAD-binding oxidoreductase [Burkholderia cepacia]TEU46666.1 FAD-binding oxidoreductase [Burkholderia cepacia]